MLPSNDIPIWLINLALLAVVSTPFVIAAAIHAAARYVVRPMWADYHLRAQGKVPQPPQALGPLQQSAPEDRRAAHIALSQFGR